MKASVEEQMKKLQDTLVASLRRKVRAGRTFDCVISKLILVEGVKSFHARAKNGFSGTLCICC